MPRDSGLSRAVHTWGLAAAIFNTVVGAGIFAVPAALAASAGVYAPFAFLICGAGIGSVAICFAEGGSRIPTSGGPYGYIQAAFGPAAGYITGNLYLISDLLASAGVAAALGDAAASLFPGVWAAPVRLAVIVAVPGGIAWVNLAGIGGAGRLVGGVTVLKLLPLAVFLVAGAAATHPANLPAAEPASGGFGRAMILALFAFTGMEVPLCASGEIARPERTIPRALAMAMLPIVLLYAAIQLVAQGILGPALPHSAAPLADAMLRIHPALRWMMLGGAALSMLGYLASDILGTPRLLFAFARDGLLPRVLGRVHPNRRVPHIAILTYTALAVVLAASGTFAELAVLSTLAVAVVYMLACAAAWALARRGVAEAGEPLQFRWLGAAAASGIGSMLALIAFAARNEIAGLVAVAAASGLAYTGIRRARKSRIYSGARNL
ncbi:MAG TPA: amino acid permease [Bryobacteraceae bacterium]|nr:amino acid permease [Bryobacteraceae bacterium]